MYVIMPSRAITINEEAYERLNRLKSSEKESFSDVILRCCPEKKKKKLSEVIGEIGLNPDLADAIEKASWEMRKV